MEQLNKVFLGGTCNGSNKIPQNTVLCILEKDKFDEGMRRSLNATEDLVRKNGAIVCTSLEEVANVLNTK